MFGKSVPFKNLNFVLFLIFIYCFSLIIWQPFIPFSTRGEPREALVVQSMIRDSNYILPKVYNNEVPSKPPFLHWCIVGFSKIYGEQNELTSRLPSFIASLLFLISFFIILKKETNNFELSAITTIILSTSFEWIRSTVACRVDMLHSATLCGAIISLYYLNKSGFKENKFFTIFFLSISTLTKGPVGLALPIFTFMIFNFVNHILYNKSSPLIIFKQTLPILFKNYYIWLLPLFVYTLWFVLAYFRAGNSFIDKFYYENILRFTSSTEDTPHKHSFLYLIGVTFLGILPWSFYYIMFIAFIIKRNFANNKIRLIFKNSNNKFFKFSSFKTKSLFYFTSLKSLKYGEFHLLSIISILTVFCFYGIPSSKRSVYVLSIYPFIAFLLAIHLQRLWGERALKKVLAFSMVIFISVTLVNSVILPIYTKNTPELDLAKQLKPLNNKNLYSYKIELYSLSYYLNRTIFKFDPEQIKNGDLVILSHKQIEDFTKTYQSKAKFSIFESFTKLNSKDFQKNNGLDVILIEK